MPLTSKNSPQSDAFLASIVNSSSDAIISEDLDGVITSWNRSAERMFGYGAEEAIGQPVTLLFPPERYGEAPELLARMRSGEPVDEYQTVRQRKNGTLIDVSLTASPIRNLEGRVIGIATIVRDISEEKRRRDWLRVSLSSVGDGVIVSRQSGEIAYMNAVAERLTGWGECDSLGRSLTEVFRTVDETTREPSAGFLDAPCEPGAPWGLANHLVLIARDGRERLIQANATGIRSESGEREGLVVVFRDISDRRFSEFAVRRLAAVVDGSDDAIVAKDLKGIVTDWNAGAERLFGYTAAEMIGQPILKLFPPERVDEEEHILGRLQRGERVDHFETERVRKDGKRVHVSVTISPIRDAAGRIVGASKIARDITALRQAQRQLKNYAQDLEIRVRERTAQLDQTVAELESFSYSLSHDLRAPVRSIQSFTEIVLADYKGRLPGESEDILRRVVNSAARMDRLIQDVLAFARASRLDVEMRPVDLNRLVDDILHERPELQPPKARIAVEKPLPKVMGHDASLVQCLTNLLDNAVKFVKPGVMPEVKIYGRPMGERARICIQDNGIGIDQRGRQQLFAMFHRLPTEHNYQGTGVGLAIVRKSAERMNGSTGVESLPGHGSTFWIELPVAK